LRTSAANLSAATNLWFELCLCHCLRCHVLVLSFFNDMLLDGAAKVQVNLFVRSIATISDIKMVSWALAPDWLTKVMML
jgi:hypothetical protein